MADDRVDVEREGADDEPQTDAERIAQGPAANTEPVGGIGTSASGGNGTGSDRQSSGGTGEGETVAGDDPETEWLRRVNDGETPAPTSSND